MVVGIDASGWSNRRGFGRFTRTLVHALLTVDRCNQYLLFFAGVQPPDPPAPPAARCVSVATSEPLADAILPGRRRRVVDLWRMVAAVWQQPLDAFFFPAIDGYFPVPRSLPTVVTIHDLIPEREPHLTALRHHERLLRHAKVRFAIGRADRIVTGSERSRDAICTHFGLPSDRVATIPYAADPMFRPPESLAAARQGAAEQFHQRAPYLLCVAAPGPHKNLARLLAAFAQVVGQRRFDGVTLIVAGQPGPAGQEPPNVRFMGHVPDPDLIRLYQAAEAVIIPSLREGFGLPAIEAAACGAPVIVANTCPARERLGEAAVGFNPNDTAELQRVLETVLGDASARERLRRATRIVPGACDWRRSAEQAVAVFTEVVQARLRTGAAQPAVRGRSR